MKYDVVIIGAGPGGIFAAYELVKEDKGLKVAVFEAGNELRKRKCPIDGNKIKSCIGCKTCSIMSGFGGAGAFSDGKLYTGTRDVNRRFILQEMIEAGAPAEIAYLSRPHVGSDKLPLISINLRRKIEALGGKFLYFPKISQIHNFSPTLYTILML